LPQINYPYHYTTFKFMFFLCIQHFCTWFCHRPIAAVVGRAPVGRATPRPRSTATTLQPPAPRPWLATTSHATQRSHHGPCLPLDATVAPWLRHGPCRVCQGCCHSRLATPSHSQPPSKLKEKNQKIIWPNMGSNPTPLGRSKNISTH
jgi:hypothetical protein